MRLSDLTCKIASSRTVQRISRLGKRNVSLWSSCWSSYRCLMPPSLLEVVASANVSHVVVLDDRYWGSKLHGQVRLNISDLEVRILFSAP